MMRKTPYQNTFLLYGAAITLIVLINFGVTAVNPAGTITNLDGIIGTIDHGSLWVQLDPVSNLFYSIGDYCCHQELARSISLNGNQMPICIRETFLLMGMAGGFSLLSFNTWLSPKERFVVCTILILITPAEWGFEHYLGLSSSIVRATVSLVSGFAFAGFLSAILETEYGILERRR